MQRKSILKGNIFNVSRLPLMSLAALWVQPKAVLEQDTCASLPPQAGYETVSVSDYLK
jgi:hypothetical protein